jgi:hypothetical protein
LLPKHGRILSPEQQNKTAIAERGWGPLNYYCLLHPEIMATHQHNASNNNNHGKESNSRDGARSTNIMNSHSSQQAGVPDSCLIAEQLNLSQGLAGSLIDRILDTRIRDDARNGVNREENRLKKIESALEVINSKSKHYSAGTHVAAQRYLLGPEVLDNIEERQQQQVDKMSERQEKKHQEFRSLRAKVTVIKALQKESQQLNVSQLKIMVTWYKRVGDLPIPSRRNLLIERLNSTRCRSDPVEPSVPSAHVHAPTQQEEAWDSSNEVLNNNVESPADHEAEAADNEAGEPSDEEICTCSAIEVDNTPLESDEI